MLNFKKTFSVFITIIMVVSMFSLPVGAANEKLPAPDNFKASEVTESYIRLSWDAVTGADGYALYMYDNQNKEYSKFKTTTKDNYKVKNLSANTKYKFKIATLIKVNEKYKLQNESKVLTVKTEEEKKLAAPSNIKSTAKASSIVLTWDSVQGASAYKVYALNIFTNDWEKYKTVTGTQCTIKDLESNTTYQFKIATMAKVNGKSKEQNQTKTITAKTKNAYEINSQIEDYQYKIYELESYVTTCDNKIALCDDGMTDAMAKVIKYKKEVEKARNNKTNLVFVGGTYIYEPDYETISYYKDLQDTWQSYYDEYAKYKKDWEKEKSEAQKLIKDYNSKIAELKKQL